MSNLEPSDVGPAAGGDLQASEEDRQRVVALLAAARAEGRLSPEDHDLRLQAALKAQTFDDLIPLTRDLVALDQPPAPTSPTWATLPTPDAPTPPPVDAASEPDLVFSIFGSVKRTGLWQARRYISALTIFGSATLDLTQATFLDSVCEISVFCLFGEVTVIVPDGVTVRNECIPILGEAQMKWLAPPVPGAPTVILKGVAGFGSAVARGPKKRG